MKPTAEEVARWLASQGVGVFAGSGTWAVYAHEEPTKPDNVITVYDTGGQDPDTDELDLYRPTFQVRVRAIVYADAYEKQAVIRDLLIMNPPVITENSTLEIDVTSEILPIGRDESKRFILTANYRCVRKET